MRTQGIDLKELAFRFSLGGSAVVLCYVISLYSPVKFLGGVFAGFPAVMMAAVIMAGLRDGSSVAADVARGAVAGMIGCAACVLSALYLMQALSSWPLGLAGAVLVWLLAALAGNLVISGRGKQSAKAARKRGPQ